MNPSSSAPDEALSAGRVGRAHGLDGSFHVTGARPRLLELGGEVRIAGRTAAIERRAGTDRHPILRVSGVEDRSGAQALRGQALMVAVANAPALAEDEWWAHELEGCVVVDGERRIGTVTRMIELPSCEALEVAVQTGGALLVPMVKDAIRNVDVAAGRIDVDLGFIGE
ncbi:MAG TPA: ribosome maturation factor RimM [Solirubrobacteraceae bacterium]